MEDNFFKKIAKFLLLPFWGKKIWQKPFELLHLFALKGMNIGGGATYSLSGEKWVLNYLASKNENSAVILDGGANVGNYALMAESIFAKHGRPVKIFSFEPSAATFLALQKNIGRSQNIVPVNSGLGETQGRANLYSDKQGSGLASVYNRDLPGSSLKFSPSEQITLTSIDKFCADKQISVIDFLKLDIEGHEMAALRGSSVMLKRRAITAIQFEFGGADIDARVFFKDFYNLLSPDFNLYRILQNGLYPLKYYRETDEVFITTNFLAIKKPGHNYAG
jgi:FkbM family methyltransferase